jgi:hypothetical protein
MKPESSYIKSNEQRAHQTERHARLRSKADTYTVEKGSSCARAKGRRESPAAARGMNTIVERLLQRQRRRRGKREDERRRSKAGATVYVIAKVRMGRSSPTGSHISQSGNLLDSFTPIVSTQALRPSTRNEEMAQNVRVDWEPPFCTITFDDPDTLNSFTNAGLFALLQLEYSVHSLVYLKDTTSSPMRSKKQTVGRISTSSVRPLFPPFPSTNLIITSPPQYGKPQADSSMPVRMWGNVLRAKHIAKRGA